MKKIKCEVKIPSLICLSVLLSCGNPGKKAEALKPNVIVILVDDLGYNDLGCYNTKDPGIQTPNIDRLAEAGIRFTDWQSANSVCAPSRAAILTGRYTPRNGQVVVSHPFDKDQYEHLGLYQDEVTIAELLKPLGYATAAIGKWHLGQHVDYRPLRHGFDQYYGTMHNIAIGKKGEIYEGDSLTGDSAFYENIHKLLTNEAKTFMNKSIEENSPFFMYLSHYLVHGPWEPSREFATDEEWQIRTEVNGDINHKVYPAMVRELDWHIGEIIGELERLGISENTVIFFVSDNGPWLTTDTVRSAGSAWPLRGSKFNTFEGGHRVPAIVKYPGKIPAGRVSNELVSSMDILPTIAHITGASMPDERVIDGKNIWPILSAEEGAESPHKVLYGYHGKNLQTIRKGNWKLHLPRTPQSVPFYAQHKWGRATIDSLSAPMLFNLEQDVKEQINVVSEFPEIVKDLLVEAKTARAELGDWNVTGTDEHDYNGLKGDIHAIPVRNR
ncbi:MAG: sulfatase-like hydrolase/transferase [Bacteroidetes bacterium]|nr:sulfatase-like hydrolase/transferase [Bacteroidota bacterium]MDA1119306.1 sulfatase-like hydrolase/transferase [Bacteroidota bacterium]